MAILRDITSADQVFYDTDNVLRYAVYDNATLGAETTDPDTGLPTYTNILNGTALHLDMSTRDMAWTLRKTPRASTPLIHKTTDVDGGITVTGTFDASMALNTQRVEVRIKDTDTYDPDSSPTVDVRPSTTYHYALKTTDEDSESMLVYGKFTLIQAAAWE